MRPAAVRLGRASRQGGFTLLEMLLVTAIGSIVVLMAATALNHTLRIWEKQRRAPVRDLAFFLDLFREQVACFWSVPLRLDKKDRTLFTGDGHSFALTTTRSVTGLHGGAPVIARYVFVPGQGRLYYAEMPVPGAKHMELAEQFLAAEPREEAGQDLATRPGKEAGASPSLAGNPARGRFYSAAAKSVSFTYQERVLEGVTAPWQERPEKLAMIRAEALATPDGRPDIRLIYPGHLDFQPGPERP